MCHRRKNVIYNVVLLQDVFNKMIIIRLHVFGTSFALWILIHYSLLYVPGYQRNTIVQTRRNQTTINELLLFNAWIRISKVNYSRWRFFIKRVILQSNDRRGWIDIKDKLMQKTCWIV